MSVATFTDTMADIQIELSDREIYNDIRSKIDITEETETVGDGTPADYGTETVTAYVNNLLAGASRDVTLNAKSGHTGVTWTGAVCTHSGPDGIFDMSEAACIAAGGTWFPPYDPSYPLYSRSVCYFGQNTDQITVAIMSRTGTSITVRVTNTSSLKSDATVRATYEYLAQQARSGPIIVETETRTLTVRTTDDTSIAKCGRRVMDLRWPLGQTQEQMQSLVDGYKARHKDAVVTASMRILGSTDALITQILTRRVSDRITINHTVLSMSVDFFINSISNVHDSKGILEAVWELEQVRDMEAGSIFTLDTSELDGPDVLGW